MVDPDRERVRRYVQRLDATRRNLGCEVEDDVAPVRDLTLEERGAWVASACRSAWAILRSRPDGAAAAREQEPPAHDFAGKWQVLMARRTRARE